ncbi:MAG TPA: PIN domain-containing protein [Thermoguttaceae bacterium]
MKILVDTCVWSAVLRHKNPHRELTKRLKDFITDGRVAIIGPIRQELLSGIPNTRQFNQLKGLLSPFEDIPLRAEHFIKAAEFANICRSKGIQGSIIDFLICSVAYLENLAIFTTDNDFANYKKYLPIKILK